MYLTEENSQKMSWLERIEYSISFILSPFILAFLVIFKRSFSLVFGLKYISSSFLIKYISIFMAKVIFFSFLCPLLLFIAYSLYYKKSISEVICLEGDKDKKPIVFIVLSYLLLLYFGFSGNILILLEFNYVIALICSYLLYIFTDLVLNRLKIDAKVSLYSLFPTTIFIMTVSSSRQMAENAYLTFCSYLILIGLIYTIRLRQDKDNYLSLALGSLLAILGVLSYALIFMLLFR